jgi:hypothetical protein
MTYPCTNDGRCGQGLSCCETTCGYLSAQRMCVPRGMFYTEYNN